MPEGEVRTSNSESNSGDKGKRRFDGVFEFVGRFKPEARKLKVSLLLHPTPMAHFRTLVPIRPRANQQSR